MTKKAKARGSKKAGKPQAKAQAGKPLRAPAAKAKAGVDPDRFDEMRERLRRRVKPSRYAHSLGVSQTAEQLARIYGVDEAEAAVAGLLHDWDKGLTLDEVRRKAKRLGVAPRKVRRDMPGVLHAFTAAATLRSEFPELSDAVLQAIARHTCGAPHMAPLDMVVYVADLIEPGRHFPDIAVLRGTVGTSSLEELFFQAYKANLFYLISAGQGIYPASLAVYNRYARRCRGMDVEGWRPTSEMRFEDPTARGREGCA